MKSRFNYNAEAPEAIHGLIENEKYIRSSKLDPKIRELIKMRVSQINGCAFCLDMHSRDARKMGETEQRLYVLNAWRETPFFTDKERVALEWAEALTLIWEHKTTDELYARVNEYFKGEELMALTLCIININSWNRLAISFKKEPGSYKPR